MIERIDAKILVFFTKIAHAFQILTGRSNYFLAKCCFYTGTTISVVFVFGYWITTLHKILGTTSLDLVFEVIKVLGGWFLIFQLDRIEEKFNNLHFRRVQPIELMDIRIAMSSFFRRFFLVIWMIANAMILSAVFLGVGLSVASMLSNIQSVLYLSACYLVSVDPLTPSMGKIKRWFNNLRSLSSVLRPAPVKK